MRVGVSTAHLLAAHTALGSALDHLAALAPDCIAVAAGEPEPLAKALIAALRKTQVPLQALEAFAPVPRPNQGPSLCALDHDERAHAVMYAERSLRVASELGIPCVVLCLGRMPLALDLTTLFEPFSRAELTADLLAEARSERSARAPKHLAKAESVLEHLLKLAERLGVRLALVNRPGHDEIPLPEEAALLLREFQGAPLGTFFDTAAAYTQDLVGITPLEASLEAFAAHALGVHLTDAAGPVRGLPPGIGEVDFAAFRGKFPGDAPLFAHCAPRSQRHEVEQALAAMRTVFSG